MNILLISILIKIIKLKVEFSDLLFLYTIQSPRYDNSKIHNYLACVTVLD